jgi:hypothetical protein
MLSRLLDNVHGVTQELLLIGQQGLDISSGTGPCLPLGWKILQMLRQQQGNLLIRTAPLTLSEAPAASQLTFDQLNSTGNK